MTRRQPFAASTSELTPQLRKVAFDWAGTPLEWIPGQPFASHFINEINLLLPAGEFWFCKVYNKALPLVSDARLRRDIRGFLQQEAMHARAHSSAIADYLNAHGVETESNTRREDWLFERLLCDEPFGRPLPRWAERQWLLFRLGLIAAVEHMTCVLGKYALDNTVWDAAGADATLLDLLRWHGAEEVEHRCVAFDTYRHLGGRYWSRYHLSLIVFPLVFGLWAHGAAHLMQQDPAFRRHRPSAARPWLWREWQRVSRSGHLPSLPWLIRKQLPFFSPWYDPRKEADTQQALDYLNQSPAAARAARRAA